ncbi:MFS transporter [Curtobacterium sp. 9128]|uniref:MFS transporter n=1 Tax=Curtobacterium sp. 9128 TaxID=1793722 RepID=UPI0011A81DD6|nr:MFS transporter [Curtobacterium sp. 9128]
MRRPRAEGPLRTLIVISFVDAVGTGAFLTGSVVYASDVLGQSTGAIGVTASAAVVAGILVTVPAGRYADRRSPRQLLLLCGVARVIVFAVLPAADSLGAYFVIVVIAASCEAAARPAQLRLLFLLTPAPQRVVARASLRNSFNIGAAVGALVASVPLAIDTTPALQTLVVVNAVSFLGVSVATLTLPGGRAGRLSTTDPSPQRTRPAGQMRFALFALASGVVVGVGAGTLETGLPLQITRNTAAPVWTISGVFVLNAVLSIALQRRAASRVDTLRRGATANALAAGALAAALSLLPLATHGGPAGATVCIGLITLLATSAEVLAAAGAWAMSYDIARDTSQAQDVALFGLAAQIVAAVMPATAALGVTHGAPVWFVVAATVAAAGAVAATAAFRVPDAPQKTERSTSIDH